jgi:hypothetical protein
MLGLLESEEEMVVDYRIFCEDCIYDMELKVLDYLKKGYEPQGGVCAFYTKLNNTRIYQVMVKREEG